MLSRARDVAFGFFQFAEDEIPFGVFADLLETGEALRRGTAGSRDVERYVACVDAGLRIQNDDALHHVLELPHISGPMIGIELAVGLRRQFFGLAAVGLGEGAQKVIGQQRDVALAIAQRRHVEGNDVEAIEEILPEVAALDLVLQIFVSGGDDAHVDLGAVVGAQRGKALLVKGAQHLGLGAQAHVGHLIQEQSAAVGALKLAHLIFGRAAETAFAMPE